MQHEGVRAPEAKGDGPRARGRLLRWGVTIAVLAAALALLVVFRPQGATYEKYLRLQEGMTRQKAVAIIGQADYWHHFEGDLDVTNWVNKDGTYIRAVFDKRDVLVEVSWESGWDPEWQTEEER